MRMSDAIAELITSMLEEDGVAEIQRNELAGRLNCVPSQINYVLTTRFSPENGYVVESRRGGGGYIRISRVMINAPSLLMHAVASIGGELEPRDAEAILRNLMSAGELSRREASMLLNATCGAALSGVPRELRASVRAEILKRALTSAARSEG